MKENARSCVLVVDHPKSLFYFVYFFLIRLFVVFGHVCSCNTQRHSRIRAIRREETDETFYFTTKCCRKTELIPLLSFQQQIPAGARETLFSSRPAIHTKHTHMYAEFLIVIQLHRICFTLLLGTKYPLSLHTICTSLPIKRFEEFCMKKSTPWTCKPPRLWLLKSAATSQKNMFGSLSPPIKASPGLFCRAGKC